MDQNSLQSKTQKRKFISLHSVTSKPNCITDIIAAQNSKIQDDAQKLKNTKKESKKMQCFIKKFISIFEVTQKQ